MIRDAAIVREDSNPAFKARFKLQGDGLRPVLVTAKFKYSIEISIDKRSLERESVRL